MDHNENEGFQTITNNAADSLTNQNEKKWNFQNTCLQAPKVEKITNMANLTEHIIELVKQYPILYDSGDPEYKNIRKKDQIWDGIGREVGESGNTIKVKWKSLRDNYTKHLRSLQPVGPVHIKINNYKSWPWAKQMEPFRPFMKSVTSVSHNGDMETSDQVSEELVVQPEVNIGVNSDLNGVKRRRRGKKRMCQESSVEQLISYLPDTHNEPPVREHDAIELMFLGLAKTIKTFSPKRQALVKMKVATMVMEQEYEQREEEERWPSGTSSNGARTNVVPETQGPTFPSTSAPPTHTTQPSTPFSTTLSNPFHWSDRSIR